jgi:hypothetical protein
VSMENDLGEQADGYSRDDSEAEDEVPIDELAEPPELESEYPVSAEPLPLLEPPLTETVINDEEDEEHGHLTELVCDSCLELNLTTRSAIECARCGKAFCYHFASKVDVQYCVNCLSDISMTKEVIVKTYEHKTEQGKDVFYRRRARAVRITGMDWLFAQRKISDLSDIELDLDIEYHRNIYKLMLDEQERRRTEKMHRYANTRVVLPSSPATKSSSTTTTTVKKTRTVSKDKAAEQLAALLSSMKSKGVNMAQLQQLLKKK